MGGGRDFVRAVGGSVAPLTAVLISGLVGMGALAFDISRGFALYSELEAAADAAALAAATQLDGKTGAIARAQSALTNALVANGQRTGTTAEGNVISGTQYSVRYFQTLATPRVPVTSDATANFVEVTVQPRELGLIFGAVVGVADIDVSARAVAGYGSALCKVPPLMICNPTETSSPIFDADNHIGKSFVLTPPPGGNTQWGSGNFGFLRVGTGANAIRDSMGRSPPVHECLGEVVQTEPGNISSADQWFNTRFDIYAGSAAGNQSDADFAPALNTMIGATGSLTGKCALNTNDLKAIRPTNSCASTTGLTAMGFPVDCDQTSSTPVGNGVWNVQQYFNSNHPGLTTNPSAYTPEVPSGATGSGWSAYGPDPVAGATRPTRYQVYNWELAMLSGAITRPLQAFGRGQRATTGQVDSAAPRCNTTNPVQFAPDRRTISAVVVNCRADNVRGTSTVNVIAYVDLFLTAPAVEATIYGEIIGATNDSSDVGKETRIYTVRLYE